MSPLQYQEACDGWEGIALVYMHNRLDTSAGGCSRLAAAAGRSCSGGPPGISRGLQSLHGCSLQSRCKNIVLPPLISFLFGFLFHAELAIIDQSCTLPTFHMQGFKCKSPCCSQSSRYLEREAKSIGLDLCRWCPKRFLLANLWVR